MVRIAAIGSAVSLLSLFTLACSGGHGAGTDPANPNPSPTTTPGNTDPSFVVQRGTIIDFETDQVLKGATISANGASAVSDDKGHYELKVKKNEPFEMVVTAPRYAKVVEQETVLAADYDRGKTTIPPLDLANLLHATLQGYDATLGVLSVAILPTASCKSAAGSKITVSPAGAAKVKYVVGKMPSNTAKDVQEGEFPSAIIYNLQPSVPITVTIESDSCKQVAFPFAKDGITYGATVSTEPGDVTSFQRLFLKGAAD